jgi:hypothetical protein
MTSKLGNMKFLNWQTSINKWSLWKMENLHGNVFKIGTHTCPVGCFLTEYWVLVNQDDFTQKKSWLSQGQYL